MSQAYLRKVELLRGQYLAELPQDLAQIGTLITLIRDGRDHEESWELLHRVLHDNAGNAGMLSFARLEALFRDALAPLETSYPVALPPEPGTIDRIAEKVELIRDETEKLRADLGV
ncbi:hypothetical protein E0K89_002785 [Aquicoccus sp. SCR17]|nr:hypothetical protein [Carideicomes alvinocaridis]